MPAASKQSVGTAPSGVVTKPSVRPAATSKGILKTASSMVAKPGVHPTLNLKHLAADLAASHKLSKKQTEAVLGDLVGIVTRHIKTGGFIRISGIGVLSGRRQVANADRKPMWVERSKIQPVVKSTTKKRVRDLSRIEPSAARAVPKSTGDKIEPVASAHEPSARARALLRGKEICENDLRVNGGSFTLAQVESFLGISRQAIDKKVQDDALLAVPGPQRRRRYPVAQFIGDGTVPGLQDVLKNLPSANGWFRFHFLTNTDSHLGGRRPIDLLMEGEIDPVVRAAKAVGVQGA